jgi:signal transduction histidine kinase
VSPASAQHLRITLGLLALALCPPAYFAFLDGAEIDGSQAAVTTFFLLAFVAAGLIAWERRPENRLGPLLTLFAFTEIVSAFQHSSSDLAFTVGYLFVAVPLLMLGHLALAFPTGRLESKAERLYLTVAYPAILLAPLARLLVYDPLLQDVGINECKPAEVDDCPESLFAVAPSARAFELASNAAIAIFVAAAAGIVVLLVRRFHSATPRRRRALAPLLVTTCLLFVAIVLVQLSQLRDQSELVAQIGFLLGGLAQATFVASLLVGMLRSRLGEAAVSDLLVEIERSPPERIRDALARTLADPSLEVALWLPDQGTYVDDEGQPLELPRDDPPERGRTHLAREDGEPLALFRHDAGLRDDSALLEAACAAARLSLENAQLQAELRARLREVEASRARIVEAGDRERRRVERNIHDGAQQRLVALALALRVAQEDVVGDSRANEIIAGAIAELQQAVEELRELARGLHPTLLADEGLGPALESLAERTPLPVDLRLEGLDGRLAADIELSAYFVACEAVANAVKHAGASRIVVAASRGSGELRLEVRDDGEGGADPQGSGLRGLADRVAAQGGTLRIREGVEGGTTVAAGIPLEGDGAPPTFEG